MFCFVVNSPLKMGVNLAFVAISRNRKNKIIFKLLITNSLNAKRNM